MGKLIEEIETTRIRGPLSANITGLAHDSRQVHSGDLFVAVKGTTHDGHAFISEALRKGARAIISEEPYSDDAESTCVQVPDSRYALAQLSARFFGNPSMGMKVVGITGTNGKTTTTYLLESIFRRAGDNPGVIGTVNYRFGTAMMKSANTTPGVIEMQHLLRDMKEGGVSHVVMEVSSHALDQDRVEGIHFDVAVFTNLTSDHLDYHKTIDHYVQSKEKLFSRFLEQSDRSKKKFAVINNDDPFAKQMEGRSTAERIHYGLRNGVDVTIENLSASLHGISGRMKTFKGASDFYTPLIGMFNIYNVMAAASTALCLDVPLETICSGIEALPAVPGRMERIGEGTVFNVLVDYAHTPDALGKTLSSVRDMGRHRIITVFGCGGDRDRSKRPVMGRIAGSKSDVVIVTSDNPRREKPEQIIGEILAGLEESGMPSLSSPTHHGETGYLVVEDRRQAITTALAIAREGDIVLVAGKGHEDYQIVGTKIVPFDDREVIRAILDAG